MTAALAVQHITENFAVAAQLTPAHFAEVAALGFRAVINNRPDYEAGSAQPTHAALKAAAEAAGLQYAFVPIPPSSYTAADVALMRESLAALPGPVLAFCRSGRRSAGLFQVARN